MISTFPRRGRYNALAHMFVFEKIKRLISTENNTANRGKNLYITSPAPDFSDSLLLSGSIAKIYLSLQRQHAFYTSNMRSTPATEDKTSI